MTTGNKPTDCNVGDSALEYPSTAEYIEDYGKTFDRMSGVELDRLREARFVANDTAGGLPDTETLIDFLTEYPFCFAAGVVRGDPCGPTPEIYVTYVGYNEEDALNATRSMADVNVNTFRKDFMLTFYDASEITAEHDYYEAVYRWE